MAKGDNQKGNREAKKPKADKKVAATAPPPPKPQPELIRKGKAPK